MRDPAERRRRQAQRGRAPRSRRSGPRSTGDQLPGRPGSRPRPPRSRTPRDYAGTYAGDDGRTLVVEGDEDGLAISIGPVSARLERDPLVADPGWIVPGRAPGVRAVPARVPARRRRPRRRGLPRRHVVPGRALPGARTRGTAGGVAPASGHLPQRRPLERRCSGSSCGRAAGDPLARRMPATRRGASSRRSTTARSRSAIPALPRRVRFEGDVRGMTAVTVVNGGRWYRSFEP